MHFTPRIVTLYTILTLYSTAAVSFGPIRKAVSHFRTAGKWVLRMYWNLGSPLAPAQRR